MERRRAHAVRLPAALAAHDADQDPPAVPTVRKYRNSKGNYLYDLGQNASGIVRLSVRASGRHTVRMFPGELCRPDSTVNQRSSGGPVFFSYTTRGDGSVESWQPQFTYYGFRYVEVEGAVPRASPIRTACPRSSS